MNNDLNLFTKWTNEAKCVLRASLEIANNHYVNNRQTEASAALDRAARWAAIYTACRLILAEEQEKLERDILKWEAMENDGSDDET